MSPPRCWLALVLSYARGQRYGRGLLEVRIFRLLTKSTGNLVQTLKISPPGVVMSEGGSYDSIFFFRFIFYFNFNFRPRHAFASLTIENHNLVISNLALLLLLGLFLGAAVVHVQP